FFCLMLHFWILHFLAIHSQLKGQELKPLIVTIPKIFSFVFPPLIVLHLYGYPTMSDDARSFLRCCRFLLLSLFLFICFGFKEVNDKHKNENRSSNNAN